MNVIREQIMNVHNEMATATEQISGRIGDMESGLRDEIQKGQAEMLSRMETYGIKRGLLGRMFGK